MRIGEQIGADLSHVQDEGAPHRRLGTIRPRYTIYNDDDHPIRGITTGVRRRADDAGGASLEWHATEIRPRTSVVVQGYEIPPALFADVHESEGQKAFVVWARFEDIAGQRWEVSRDAQTGATDVRFNPPPLAGDV